MNTVDRKEDMDSLNKLTLHYEGVAWLNLSFFMFSYLCSFLLNSLSELRED
jgi:hypothetical protein